LRHTGVSKAYCLSLALRGEHDKYDMDNDVYFMWSKELSEEAEHSVDYIFHVHKLLSNFDFAANTSNNGFARIRDDSSLDDFYMLCKSASSLLSTSPEAKRLEQLGFDVLQNNVP